MKRPDEAELIDIERDLTTFEVITRDAIRDGREEVYVSVGRAERICEVGRRLIGLARGRA